MSMVINTNIASINSQRHISTAVREQSEAMERLSSGKRINSSKDDAAGLGIANRMTSQIRGLDQAVRNANDGISMIQIAEGALDQTTTVLQRMRELAIQSANGTYNDGENRQALDAEFQQLLQEIDRISESTMFNGNALLDGTMKNTTLQIGADAYQTVEFGIGDMGSKSLGMGSISTDVLGTEIYLTASSYSSAGSISIGYNDININGQSIVKPGGTEITSASSKDDLVNAINKNVNGITASLVTINEITKTGDGTLNGSDEVSVTLTMADGSTQTFEVRDVASFDELASKLNDTSNGLLEATNNDNKFTITAEGVASIVVSDTTTSIGSSTSSTAVARLALTSDDGDPITIERGTTGSYADLAALGFREFTNAGTIEGHGITAPSTPWDSNDVSINGVSITEASTSSSLLSKVDAVNAVSDQTGVTAETFVTAEIDFSSAALSGVSLIINGFSAETVDLNNSTALSQLAYNINQITDQTGITATLSGETIQLEGNASSLVVTGNTASTVGGLVDADLTVTKGNTISANSSVLTSSSVDITVYGGLKLTSETGNPISLDLGTDAISSPEQHGFIETNTTAEGFYGTSINGLSIESADKSQKSIGIIDRAITSVSQQRGELGAINNRLEHAIDSMMNVSQQTSAARSRITDTDFAKESAALSRAQVLQQAGTAMLSQANAAPNQVLQLLQG